jgi:signal transduction histidine kinase
VTRRIVLTVVSVTVVAIAVFFVPAALAIRSARERGELLELQREASVVASQLGGIEPVDPAVLESAVNPSHRIALYGTDGRFLAGSGPASGGRVVQAAIMGNFAEGRVGPDLVAAVPVRAARTGDPVVVRIEAPGSESRARFIRSLVELALVAVAIIVAAFAGASAVARRINRPIDDLRRWAASGSPEHEPPDQTGIPELDALRDEMIADRERIDELLRRERSFSSSVSHQLRTPVAAMRVAIEAEVDSPRPEPTTVLTETLGQIDRLESTISSLLALARHDARPRVAVPLASVVRSVAVAAEDSEPCAGRDRIAVRGTDVEVVTDRTAVEHIVTVLIDNALRHGRGSIVVSVTSDGREAAVDVADDGERPIGRDVFAERSTDPAHGIGLRLARTLAESIGGSLVLRDIARTTFRLTVPIAADDA